jgi:hypothetical protein
MKLLFCPRCLDVFKLVIFEPRSCRCGWVRGHLKDNNHAVVNGKGISLCIDNWSLVESGNKLPNLQQNNAPEYYRELTPLTCYVRPHTGRGNPRSEIRADLDWSTDIAAMLGQAVKQYKQEHANQTAVPKWVEDAERLLEARRVLPRFTRS